MGHSSDLPWVEPCPENSTAALIPLADLSRDPPLFGGWTWLVGARGEAIPAALRLEADGFTLVGYWFRASTRRRWRSAWRRLMGTSPRVPSVPL